jgi:hypothetical protein
MDVTAPRVGFATRMLQVGVGALALGVLIYLSARSVGGGWAGILVSGLFSWVGFELALAAGRGVERFQIRMRPRHAFIGGCLTLIGACGVGSMLLAFGQQLVLGVIFGGVAALVTHRTPLYTLPQLGALDVMPETSAISGQPALLPWARPVAAIVAVPCLLAGIILGGLGTLRGMEAYSYGTDTFCTHPCGMVRGLWVRVLPDAHGDFVRRIDPGVIQIRLRFNDDVAGDRIASPSDFSLSHPPATYDQVTDRMGCDHWLPRDLHLGDSTSDLELCFAIPTSQEVDFSQLILNWSVGDMTAPILLGKKARSGVGFNSG